MQADGGLGRASGGQGCHPATSVDTNLEARGTDAERSSVARPPLPLPLCVRVIWSAHVGAQPPVPARPTD